MVKNQKVNWKSINFDDPNLTSEGLVAFEECTDYNLIGNVKPSKRKTVDVTSKKPKKTRKNDAKPEILSPSKEGSSLETHVEVYESYSETTAWSAFALPEPIIRALREQGYEEPTQIQALTLPAAILGRRDVIGAAETGSGKTLAFGLPVLTGIYNEKGKGQKSDRPLFALILTPTRELAMQVKNHLKAAAKYLDVNVAVVVGGMAAVKQERILGLGPEIVVATPGRLWELIQQGTPHLSKIADIRYLVIDETDRMLEKGHFEELQDLLEKLNSDENKRKARQNFVFSATLTMVHDLPKYLTAKRRKLAKMSPEQKLQKIIASLGITEPKIVDISRGGTSHTLTETRITCNIDEKDYYVYYFVQKHPGRTLIFCNSIGCVRRLSNLLSLLQCSPLPLHASMQQKQRLKNLERFRDDDRGILVATDVAARGLDIPKVEHVIHYQTPRTSESYVHRSGRTARACREGITVILIEPSEIPNYVKMCRTLEKNEDLPTFPVEEAYLSAIKQRVNLARDLDRLDLEVRKGSSEVGWLQKAAEDMDIIVDDFPVKYDISDLASRRKSAEAKRKQLVALLAKPVFPKGFSGKYPLGSNDFSQVFGGNNTKTAIEVVKTAVANTKDKRIPLFKPNKNKATKHNPRNRKNFMKL